MRILYVTTVSNTINGFLVPHIKLLIEKGNQVDVACNIVQEISPDLIKLGCKVYNIEFQRSPFKKANYKAYIKIRKLIASGEYQLVHTHTPVASFLTRLACRNIPNIKVLYTAHGFHFFKGAPLMNWLLYYPIEKWLSKYTDCLITINDEDYELAVNKLKARSVKKVPGVGVDLNKFVPQTLEKKKELRKQYGYNDDDFILIYAAEINENKNQKFLIDAMKVLKDRIANIKIIFAGTGVLKEKYEKYVRDLGLDDNVIFIGYRKDLHKLIPMCDLGVSASIREGLGMNVIEYLACGLPVVASNNRGHKEIIKDGINGFLYEQGNFSQFVHFVEKMYYDSTLRQKISENARKTVEKFSVQNVLKNLNNIYEGY